MRNVVLGGVENEFPVTVAGYVRLRASLGRSVHVGSASTVSVALFPEGLFEARKKVVIDPDDNRGSMAWIVWMAGSYPSFVARNLVAAVMAAVIENLPFASVIVERPAWGPSSSSTVALVTGRNAVSLT